MYGRTTGSNTSEMKRWLFSVPSMRTRELQQSIPIRSKTMYRVKTSMAMQNATVQQPLTTVSPNSNPTIVMRHKLDSSIDTMSFHSIVHVRRSLHHWRRNCQWFPVKG
ncbi:hypothetical protein TNCV_1512461 [Trichonephila clavipes]|nr:hypothetical protein TNCV_1512461 [Trichonephila clavipes]